MGRNLANKEQTDTLVMNIVNSVGTFSDVAQSDGWVPIIYLAYYNNIHHLALTGYNLDIKKKLTLQYTYCE